MLLDESQYRRFTIGSSGYCVGNACGLIIYTLHGYFYIYVSRTRSAQEIKYCLYLASDEISDFRDTMIMERTRKNGKKSIRTYYGIYDGLEVLVKAS